MSYAIRRVKGIVLKGYYMTSVKSEFMCDKYRIVLEFSYLFVGHDSPHGPLETSGDYVEVYVGDNLIDSDDLPYNEQKMIEKAIDTHIFEYIHDNDNQVFYAGLQL